jgi:hypothetical protein
LEKQVSGFALIRGASEAEAAADDGAPMPDLDNPKVMRAMEQLEKSLGDTQEENPRDVARMLRQVQEVLPPGSMPRDFEHAIRRLESGEDPESVEADMGDALDAWKKTSRARERDRKKQAPFRRDPGLYEL